MNGSNHKKRVFISYSSKDRDAAERVRANIPNMFDVWFDSERVQPGSSISDEIKEGLNSSDYYVILISENAIQSSWVQVEIAAAFELAGEKRISVVPVLLQGSELPIVFKGLLYIDFRKSFASGLTALKDFLLSQVSLISDIEPRQLMLKSHDVSARKRMVCNEVLRNMSLGELRQIVTERLSLEEVEVVWFDLFERRMKDETQVQNVALSSVELIDRSRRTDVLAKLIDTLCRNYPFISK